MGNKKGWCTLDARGGFGLGFGRQSKVVGHVVATIYPLRLVMVREVDFGRIIGLEIPLYTFVVCLGCSKGFVCRGLLEQLD